MNIVEISLRFLVDEIVTDLGYSYTERSTAVNPEGREEFRSFHIKNDQVEATQDFFTSAVLTFYSWEAEGDLYEKDKLIQPTRIAIIHESLHLFGYNELEARKCAPELETVTMTQDAEKLVIHQQGIKRDNLEGIKSLLSNKMCEYKRLGKKKSAPMASFAIGEEFLSCLVKIPGIKNENPKQSAIRALYAVHGVMATSDEGLKKLDKVLRFPNEKDIPKANQ